MEWLNANAQPEIILMDIELADGQSFEIFNQAEVKSVVIFTASYNEYALKAFRVNSINYLLKPIEKEDLEKALNKYLKAIVKQEEKESINIEVLLKDLHQRMNTKAYRRRFLVKNGTKFISIDANEIACFFVEGRLVFFKTFNQKKFIIDYTMDELEEMLEPALFFRINRSCFIAQKAFSKSKSIWAAGCICMCSRRLIKKRL